MRATACCRATRSLRAQYAEWLASLVGPGNFGKLRVLVDCANGAASSVAPLVFKDCDIEADFLHIDPNGRNINAGCGALHPEHVAAEVAKSNGKYDLGITFDGDADRAMFSDAAGNVVNGDGVLLLAARDMKAHVLLHNDTVVATTMSNMGLEAALKRSGIRMLRAAVGDKYVLEEMIKTGATLGGEQSGHILFRDMDTTTGDGILTALRVMEVVARAGKPLAELVSDMKVFPQRIENVNVREKIPMDQLPPVMETIRAAERELDGNGRVVVRYSGTEKLARVMVEAESEEAMERHVKTIAECAAEGDWGVKAVRASLSNARPRPCAAGPGKLPLNPSTPLSVKTAPSLEQPIGVYCLTPVFASARGASRGVGLLKCVKLVTLPEASRTNLNSSASLPSLRTRRKTSPPLGFRNSMSPAGSVDGKLRRTSPPAQGSATNSAFQGCGE